MKINFHYTFLVMLILAFLTGVFKHIIAIYTIVLLHELGHLFFCVIYKREIKKITILPFGGIIDYRNNENVALYQDFLISAGGLIVNIIMGLILYFTAKKSLLYEYNLQIMIFNILPIFPLDGGRILENILSYFNRYRHVLLILVITSVMGIILLIVINFLFIKSLAFLLVLSYLLIENMVLYKEKESNFYHFLLKKYLNPNNDLKNKRLKNVKSIPKNFFKGVNNVIISKRKRIKENKILERYFKH